ncbi:MAG: hypothetical protein IJT43_11960 [Stomatobaculum sp.]|nr:hypothetical protein [Stomatobaculum sp.]
MSRRDASRKLIVCAGEFHRAVRRRDGDHGFMEPKAASALLRGETDRADAAAREAALRDH